MKLRREAQSHITLEAFQTPILTDIIMTITTITMILVPTIQTHTMVMELENEVLSHTSLEHITIMDFIIILIIMTIMTIMTTMIIITMTPVHTMPPIHILDKKV